RFPMDRAFLLYDVNNYRLISLPPTTQWRAVLGSPSGDILSLQAASRRNNEHTLARSALWRANVVEETRIHVDCSNHSQSGHRGEYGDLQRSPRGSAQAAALRET